MGSRGSRVEHRCKNFSSAIIQSASRPYSIGLLPLFRTSCQVYRNNAYEDDADADADDDDDDHHHHHHHADGDGDAHGDGDGDDANSIKT